MENRQKELQEMFRKHLKEHHGIDTDAHMPETMVREHLEMKEILLPISIFSDGLKKLSALEVIVKFLREEERLPNAKVAKILRRTPASLWITYRNSQKKMREALQAGEVKIFIPTRIFDSGLSVLESIAYHLHEEYNLNYSEIGRLLGRDERTIWTVCNRARRKLAK